MFDDTFSYEVAQYFESAFTLIILFISIIYALQWNGRNARQIILGNRSNIPLMSVICLILCYILGFRTIDGSLFGDTQVYAWTYSFIRNGIQTVDTYSSERAFYQVMKWVMDWGGNVCIFFLIVALGYVFFALWGMRRMFKNNTTGAMLFFFGAFSFWGYAVNGIRNGLACSMIILALSFVVVEKNRRLIPAIIIAFLAVYIHRSVFLPIVAFCAAYFIRNIKVAITFWLLAIILYLLAHTAIEQLFAGLGFDDRMTMYIQQQQQYADSGFKTGFRPDFLLYSFMPILLGWYIVVKKGVVSQTYALLLNTYIFSNAIWVTLMGASYSNRFAYLSWFLYPVVLAYPCLRMNVWGESQGKVAAFILLAQIGFTAFMQFIYY